MVLIAVRWTRKIMGAREDIFLGVESLLNRKGVNEFSIKEVLTELENLGVPFTESTVRTHIASRLCDNSPKNHEVRYPDFERISRGKYRLKR
jgi:hypothetical protein